MSIRNFIIASTGVLGTMTGGTVLAADAAVDATQPFSNEIRAGVYFVNYHVSADDLTGPYVPPGVQVGAKSITTPYLAYIHRLAPHWAAQLASGIPPKTDTLGRGPATLGSVPFDGQVVSTARWFAPTFLVTYLFRDDTAMLRPYLGLGVNYTKFYDLQSTPAGNAANGGPTAISLTSSVGPAVSAGLRWHISGRWSAYASYDYAMVNTDYTGNTAGVVRRTSVRFNPTTAVVSVGYAF